MILHEVLYVTPSSPRILMLDRFKDEDPELLAQVQAARWTEVIYFMVDLIIEGIDEGEDWPDIQWMNWYGKIVTSNVYAFYSVPGGFVDVLRLTEDEIKWFLNSKQSAILFIHEKE